MFHEAFTIIPVPNPDGYVYTWDADRLWYKNRSPTGNEECIGIDMNRNWVCHIPEILSRSSGTIDLSAKQGQHWQASDNPCHHWYSGSRPFEAAEVDAIASYIERTSNIRLLIDLRSYGQMSMPSFPFDSISSHSSLTFHCMVLTVMYPYSFSCDFNPPNAEDLIEAALGAFKASKSVHGIPMTTGAACEVLYRYV